MHGDEMREAMASGADYYAILGVEPTADAAAIEAAYRSRSLPFRVGQLRRRVDETSGPSQDEVEQAYNILSNPQSRALYDNLHYPDKPPPVPPRRRLPVWLWALVATWLVAIVAVGCIGLRSRSTSDGGVIGQLVQTATVAAVADGGASATTTATPPSPTSAAAVPSATVVAVPTASAVVTTTAFPATVTGSSGLVSPTVAAATTRVATATVAPTPTLAAATATAPPVPTATQPPPTATPEPPVAAPPPEPAPEPEPEPTVAPPPFPATDRIGTPLSVNLRTGPGVGYPSLGLLPTGTLLRATGETAYSGGQLWRRFALRDGRVGWVRDLDVFVVR